MIVKGGRCIVLGLLSVDFTISNPKVMQFRIANPRVPPFFD